MSKLTDQLVAHGIYNGHNFSSLAATFGGIGVYIVYNPIIPGRGYRSANWQVIRPGFKTNPNGHWQDYGHQTFDVFSREGKNPQKAAAIAWASAKFAVPVDEWVTGPYAGTLVPSSDRQLVLDELRKNKREAKE